MQMQPRRQNGIPWPGKHFLWFRDLGIRFRDLGNRFRGLGITWTASSARIYRPLYKVPIISVTAKNSWHFVRVLLFSLIEGDMGLHERVCMV